MKPTLMKHNPAFLSRDELIKSFVVRQVDLDLIIETIKENTGNSNQHVLIIAPRGMGKTTLVLRAMASITEDNELNSQWYPIVFSEESYEVSTPAEFWLRAIFHLAKQLKNETLAQAHERLKTEKDEKRLYERSLSCLMDFADEQGKRLLLVVENVNMLFDEQIGSDESWDIRHTLLNEPRIMLLGTATSRFDGIDNAGKAMFDLFKIHSLEPLATHESKLLWEYLTGEEVKDNKIRPIHILTGGNPRLLAIISSFAVGASFRELMKQLTSLIDEYTTYFKSNIESLPALERKVFVTLANIWEPAEAATVARDARINVNKTSSLLKRLEFRGCVSALKSAGRKKSYQVTERLYNIYHLMRLSGSQSDRVRAVVDFMINFYEGRALAKKLAELTEEASRLGPTERKDHFEAFLEILNKVKEPMEWMRIVLSSKLDFLNLPEMQGYLIKMKGQFKPGQKITEESLKKNLLENPKFSNVWSMYGFFLHQVSNRPEEAEIAYRKAIEIDENFSWAWVYLAQLLHKKLERYEEAEAAYRKVIEINSKNDELWAILGQLLHKKLERYEEAEAAYRRAIEVNVNSASAWRQLIKLQIERSVAPGDIINTINQYLEISDKSAESLNDIAWVIFNTDFKEGLSTAEKLAQEAVEKEPDSFHQHTYASILGAQGKWEKALSVAVEFLKDSNSAKEYPNEVISFFTDAAAAGYAKEGLKLLKNSACAPKMEPLIVALQMLAGEEYNAPQEVVEVAKDVLKRIKEKKAKPAYH
ncbi:MAG: hypothetical protein QG657_4980 [Acidobacteriota bacterium]|nr:hypothetical protein [Acidobacteriota bacterium]